MNELEVKVNQEVGKIDWNFEELKTALKGEMSKYSNVVYDDTMIQTAKGDVAMLRKLRKAVEDRRKEIKNKCMEPYAVIEEQAKELTALIDEPIAEIDKQVKAYEEEQKAKKREEIQKYMSEKFAGLPEAVATKLKSKVYDSKWENKTTAKKTWQDAVNTAYENVAGDIEVLDGIEEEFKQTATKIYYTNLVLSEALNKVNELRRQKEMILEQERKKKEEEERRKAEQEAQRQAELQRQAAMQEAQAQKPAQMPEPVQEQPQAQPTPPAQPAAPVQQVMEKQAPQDGRTHTLRITCDKQQYDKILGYIKFVGAECVEV